MASILILYSTTDGHTIKICNRLKQVIEELGHRVSVQAIADSHEFDLNAFDKIVVGASIRYGKHQRQVHDFVDSHLMLLESKANAFFTVNIVARKANKNRPQTNPYLQKFLRQTAWRPNELAVFAGKLDYPRYGFFDRQMIRLIMLITHGPTDPQAVVEFTDWTSVDDFARRVSAMSLPASA
ncbi:MAG: protoporphyrinogen oxidase [Proteobacteria bacterium]|nr:protoporphyrinogen oxidase [Pseudomonadota bacterium]